MNYRTAFNTDTFRTLGHQLVDQLADYLAACQRKEEMTICASSITTPEAMLKEWETDFENPSPDNFLELCSKVMKYTTHLQHPNYLGHQVAVPAPINGLANLLTGVMNGSGAIFEMGAAPAAMEKVVIDFMTKQCGYDEYASGVLVSGGSLGNLTALLTARQAMAQYDVWEEGIQRQLAVMVSAEAHYCVSRAVKIMGLGEEGIIKIPVNDTLCADTTQLQPLYDQALASGKKVIAVVGNACSTSTGSFDDLAAMADFCEANQLWFHVDGAHGGATVFSSKYKHLVKGIERADSIVIDFHKMMMMPALVTAVLYKSGASSYETFTQKAEYLLNTTEVNWYNTAARTIECTRPMMSVRVYTTLKMYGAIAINQHVTAMYDLGNLFGEMITNSDDFELAIEPFCNIVCFRYSNTETENIDVLNARLRQNVIDSGKYYIVQTVVKGHIYMRCTIMNPFTSEVELKALLDLIRSLV